MSYSKVSGVVAATVTALALAGGAYGDTGKSPNGAPGPAGNPNPPAAQPQANGPQGPAGNDAQGQSGSQDKSGNNGASHGKSGSSHGKSEASHGKSNASHGKAERGKSGSAPSRSNGSHANPTPGTPRKGSNNGHAGKITICHATKSTTNPYVEITISVNGLHGHGPADDPHHHAGSWKDIIPAPAGGCPSTVAPQQSSEQPQPQQQQENGSTEQPAGTQAAPESVSPLSEVAAGASAPGSQEVLGARASGSTLPAAAGDAPAGASKVLGASASGTTPKAALAARPAGDRGGSLPFTGLQLVIVLLAAAAALLGGFALRRAAGSRS